MSLSILYSYPELCGVADNNPFGLKVYAFIRLCGMAFEQRHVLDTALAPRGQLPYLIDGDESIGDSDTIIGHLTRRHGLSLDDGLSREQHNLGLLVRRTLDDLYWCMSYARWKDERYWPSFRQLVIDTHPAISGKDMDAAHDYNALRYHYQGIGRYDAAQVYERGIANLRAVSDVLGDRPFVFGDRPRSLDAAIYGFVANIYYYDIDTPLKRFVLEQSNLVRHCVSVHALVQAPPAH